MAAPDRDTKWASHWVEQGLEVNNHLARRGNSLPTCGEVRAAVKAITVASWLDRWSNDG
jgi:hypothetical protein